MSKTPKRFAPVLRYLVEVSGMYSAPNRVGFITGQDVWAEPSLWMPLDKAREHAASVGGQVVKIRVRATAEPIKGPDAPWKAPVNN